MSERFDELSKATAGQTSRRGVLKLFVGAAGAAAAANVLRPFRGAAATCNGTPCGTNCCAAGVACLSAKTGTCGCAAGHVRCGTNPANREQPFCCTGTCINATTNCCCAAGLTPCGDACCASGVACLSSSSSTCGCPPGRNQCVTGTSANPTVTCCPAGTKCGSSGCVPVSTLGTKSTASTCATAGPCGCTAAFTCATISSSTCSTTTPACKCVTRASGGLACVGFCGSRGACTVDGDCPTGNICIVNPCTTSKICLPPCSDNCGLSFSCD